jgi:opacity protein-like surface antigen
VVHPTKSEYIDLGVPLIVDLASGAAYGLRATWWTMPRLGIEASFAGAGLEYRLTGGSELTASATLVQADARARFRLNAPTAANHFDLIGGVGVSDLQSDVDGVIKPTGYDTKNRTAWVVGLGTTLGVLTNAGIRFDFEDHIHKAHFEVSDVALSGGIPQNRTMNDLLFTAGVVVPLGSK